MSLPRTDTPSRIALASLVAANTIPLVGVVGWGWQPMDLLVLYWFETGVIRAITVPQIPFTGNRSEDSTRDRTAANSSSRDGNRLRSLINVFVACLLLVGYGSFWIVHSTVLLLVLPALFGGAGWSMNVSSTAISLGAGALLVSHAVSFVMKYSRSAEIGTSRPACS